MIKKGDIFTAYLKGQSTENVMAIMDFEEGLLLHCVNADGESKFVGKDEFGEVLTNINKL